MLKTEKKKIPETLSHCTVVHVREEGRQQTKLSMLDQEVYNIAIHEDVLQ